MFSTTWKFVIVTKKISAFCVPKLNYANENLDIYTDVSPNLILWQLSTNAARYLSKNYPEYFWWTKGSVKVTNSSWHKYLYVLLKKKKVDFFSCLCTTDRQCHMICWSIEYWSYSLWRLRIHTKSLLLSQANQLVRAPKFGFWGLVLSWEGTRGRQEKQLHLAHGVQGSLHPSY